MRRWSTGPGSRYGNGRGTRTAAASRPLSWSPPTGRCGGPTCSTGWTAPPGNYSVAHYHPQFAGDEPSSRNWDQALTADPWAWLAAQLASLGGAGGDEPWPLSPADAADLNRYADQVVAAARGFAPELCHSAEQCYQLTQDARDTVQVMIKYLERPEPARPGLGQSLADHGVTGRSWRSAVQDHVDPLVEERDQPADLGRVVQRLVIGPGDVGSVRPPAEADQYDAWPLYAQ